MSQPSDSPSVLVAQGAPISELRKHFPSKAETLEYYAQATAAGYPEELANTCCCCKAAPDFVARYSWRAVYHGRFSPNAMDLLLLGLGHIRISIAARCTRFTTYHGFCNSCWRGLFLHRCLANLLQFLSLFLGIINAVIAPVTFAMYFYFRSEPSWRNDEPGTLLVAIASTLALALCVWAFFLAHRLRAPAPLRSIVRFPFRFESMEKKPGHGPR